MFDIWYTAQNLSGYSAEHQSQAVIWFLVRKQECTWFF